MTSSFTPYGIIGAGAWGTALALVLHRAGRQVTLVARDPAFAATLAATRENAVEPKVSAGHSAFGTKLGGSRPYRGRDDIASALKQRD